MSPESRAVIDERHWVSATSAAFIKAYATFGISQPFTSDNNPNGNTDIERLMRTLKEELLWLREWASALDLERALAAWVDLYNTRYLHSTLGYRRPYQFEQEHRATVRNTDSLSIPRASDQSRPVRLGSFLFGLVLTKLAFLVMA
ncbi:MAG: integrase core domain-containing protein [Nitrospira sp.]|nr:integrase core domain-containing protein [Nitrospira sp.]